MASWDIVVFSKDNSCDYLPSTWAVNSEKKLYLWPKKLSVSQIKKLKDNCAEPNANIDYDEWDGMCKATVYNLIEAQKLADKAVYTSNLSSEDEEEVSEEEMELSDDETIERSDSPSCKEKTRFSNSTPKRYRRNIEESARLRPPAKLKDSSLVSNRKNSGPLSFAQKRISGSSHVSNRSPLSSALSPSIIKNDDPLEVNELKKITKALAGIKYEICEIKKDINEINIKLNSLNEKSRSQFPNISKFNLPLLTQQEVHELDEKIETDSENFHDLVQVLAHVGGVTPKKNVHLIMKKLMNKELSLQYSARGRKQKKDFSKLGMYKAVLEAVKMNFPSCNDLEITQHIGISLATAGDRDGGRSNRVSASTNPEGHRNY